MFDPKTRARKVCRAASLLRSICGLNAQPAACSHLPSLSKKYGRAGIDVSELLPQLASTIDDLCVIRLVVHLQSESRARPRNLFFTGMMTSMRPTVGSWISYGLGTENENLPGFVALTPNGGSNFAGSGFLPAEYQGHRF